MVVLTRTNLNTRFLREAPSARTVEPRPRRRHQARVRDATKDEVVRLYRSGMSTRAVADATGIGKTTVLKVLKDRGVELAPRGNSSTDPSADRK